MSTRVWRLGGPAENRLSLRESRRRNLRSHLGRAGLGWVVLFAACGCSRDNPADLAYRARSNYAAGRLAEADADLARLARIRRLTLPDLLLRSEIAQDRGQIDEALAVLDDLSPPPRGRDAAVVAARRGELEIARSRFRAAESELKRALEIDPKLIDSRRRLMWLYVQQDRAADIAIQGRELASAGTPSFYDLFVWTLRGRESLDAGELADVLKRAVAADPDDRASRLALVECERRLGRLDEALRTLEGLPSLDSVAARARIALDRGDSARALALLASDTAEASRPAIAQLRGRLALGQGNAAAAISHFRAALEAAPDDRDSQFGLAQALRLAGRPEEARPHAELAHALEHLNWLVQTARAPNRRTDPRALKAIGDACMRLGRRDEARGWYRIALSLAPDDPALRRALSDLGPPSAAVPTSRREVAPNSR
jgi:tetratricopeptide (TPR) repeat protein